MSTSIFNLFYCPFLWGGDIPLLKEEILMLTYNCSPLCNKWANHHFPSQRSKSTRRPILNILSRFPQHPIRRLLWPRSRTQGGTKQREASLFSMTVATWDGGQLWPPPGLIWLGLSRLLCVLLEANDCHSFRWANGKAPHPMGTVGTVEQGRSTQHSTHELKKPGLHG